MTSAKPYKLNHSCTRGSYVLMSSLVTHAILIFSGWLKLQSKSSLLKGITPDSIPQNFSVRIQTPAKLQ